MTMLMTIQLHSVDIPSFDPVPAIADWYTPRRRMKGTESEQVPEGQVGQAYDETQEMPEVDELIEHDVAAVNNTEVYKDDDDDHSDYESGSEYEDLKAACADLGSDDEMDFD